MDVASLPSQPNQSSSTSLTKLQVRIAQLIGDGTPHTDIARKLGKGDKKKTRNWRIRIRHWAATNPEFQAIIAESVRGETAVALPSIGSAVVRRGQRGRTDAAKLAMELTGFHNPRVKHEHSGDITITLAIPRPPAVVDEIGPGKPVADESIVDAEVVDQ